MTEQRPFFSGVGILTAHRPVLLERGLTSYIENSTRHSKQVEYVVFDDSKDDSGRSASLEVARSLARRFKVEIRFAGSQERAGFVNQLVEFPGISKETLENALLHPNGYTLGQNRNSLLLDSVGTFFLCVDDDTVCRIAQPPASAEGVRLCLGVDPADFWCFRDFAEACEAANFAERDLLGAHEALLGRTLADLHPIGAQAESGDRPPGLLGVRSAESVVRVTLNGLLGDCAWGTPFGLWHAPMGYLAFDGPSLDRIISSEDHYRQTLQSRQMLRIASSCALSDSTFSMLTFWGMDNRELLPPNLPVNRGQDLVFGQILWKCDNRAIFGHVPLALVHDPIPNRRFWNGEVTRSAAGVDLCRLMIEAVGLCVMKENDLAPRQRLKTLGMHLLRLGELPMKILGEMMMERLQVSNRRFESELTERARGALKKGPGYARDLFRFCEKIRSAEQRTDYWVPMDLKVNNRITEPEDRTQELLRQFGRLLVEWPKIVEAAKVLREDGIRISMPVRYTPKP